MITNMKGRREHHPLRPIILAGFLVLLIVAGQALLVPTTKSSTDRCPVAAGQPVRTLTVDATTSLHYQDASQIGDCAARLRHRMASGGVLAALVFVGVLGTFLLLRSPRDPQ